jgi:hypothetical protein
MRMKIKREGSIQELKLTFLTLTLTLWNFVVGMLLLGYLELLKENFS